MTYAIACVLNILETHSYVSNADREIRSRKRIFSGTHPPIRLAARKALSYTYEYMNIYTCGVCVCVCGFSRFSLSPRRTDRRNRVNRIENLLYIQGQIEKKIYQAS